MWDTSLGMSAIAISLSGENPSSKTVLGEAKAYQRGMLGYEFYVSEGLGACGEAAVSLSLFVFLTEKSNCFNLSKRERVTTFVSAIAS